MSTYSAINLQNKESGKEEKVYWEEVKYNYNDKMIESIQKRLRDRVGGLIWEAMRDTYQSGLENPPDLALNYEDLSDASS
ncbi:MAG: hypothetical protein AAGJ08_29790 [Cyanobacteria bacterium P01_H01_bin.35]